MADDPYLVALALVEQDGKRWLPLAGKCRSSVNPLAIDPGEEGRMLAFELILRLWQLSDSGSIKRAAGDNSLVLLEMPLVVLSKKLPLIKTKWIWDGDTRGLMNSLKTLSKRGWKLSIAKYEPVVMSNIW